MQEDNWEDLQKGYTTKSKKRFLGGFKPAKAEKEERPKEIDPYQSIGLIKPKDKKNEKNK